MKVTVCDAKQPDRVIEEDFPVDPLLGPPATGDEIRLRERPYQTNHYLTGTVLRRIWLSVKGEPHETELRLLVALSK